MKSYTIIAAVAILQGAMAQGAEEKPQLGPNLEANDIATTVNEFVNACRQDTVGQIIDGKTVPFPCNAQVQIMRQCKDLAKNVEEMKECLCRKNTDKQPSAFFEVAQACVSCNRCNRFYTIAGAKYWADRFNRIEEKFCSPENTQWYKDIDDAEGNKMPETNEYDNKTCVNKPPNILDYAKLEIQPWDAGGRFAKDVKAPQAPWGNNNTTNGTTDGNKGTDQEVAALKPVPVADEVREMCGTVAKKAGAGPNSSNGTADFCAPYVLSQCTAVPGKITCGKAVLLANHADFQPSDMSMKWSLNITFTDLIKPDTFPDCEPLPQPEKIEGNVIKGSKIIVPDLLAESYVRITQSVNIQFNTIFQQCGVCEEAAKKVKEAPEQPKIAPTQSVPAPSTPNKKPSAQPEEEDLSCEVEDEPTGGQAGSQPPVTNNINLENKINIEGGGPSPGPSGPGNDGTAPNPPSKGTAPGPEPQVEGGPAVSRPERSTSEGETPKKPMPSGVPPPGSPGNDGVAPPASQGRPGVFVSTETTTTTSSRNNGTATTPSCKGPRCAPVLVSGAGAFRASSVMAAAAAVLVAAL